MKFKLQLIIQDEWGEKIQEIACVDRKPERLDDIGITLAEAKALLTNLQKEVVEQQIATYLASRQRCPQCGQLLRHKG